MAKKDNSPEIFAKLFYLIIFNLIKQETSMSNEKGTSD
jgi:hypothetical protein